jgi:hypothetical protein
MKKPFLVQGQIVEFDSSESYAQQWFSPKGYCRLLDGKPCGCTVVWTLSDGSCPCAPHNMTNPMSKNEDTQ